MNGQTQSKIIFILIMIAMAIFVFVLLRLLVLFPTFSYQEGCILEYGEDWKYEDNKHFGRTCFEMDYITSEITNRTSYNMTLRKLYKKYCDIPAFFDLSKWDNKCIEI